MGQSASFFKKLLRPLVINDVETGDSEWYPELEPRVYDVDQRKVFDCARKVIERRDRWNVTDVRPESGQIEAEARTRVFRFVDDMTVEVRPTEDERRVRVSVHSRSRVGRGDFGKNAARIREFFDLLDECVV